MKRYVIHEHHAKRWHLDLRLEYDGVLKSWAIPKGISSNPIENRLAIEVEDHPLSYINFVGEIPKSQYGAGKVEIWDKGTYELEGDLSKGKVTVKFKGTKLNGFWKLYRARFLGKDSWLLRKVKG